MRDTVLDFLNVKQLPESIIIYYNYKINDIYIKNKIYFAAHIFTYELYEDTLTNQQIIIHKIKHDYTTSIVHKFIINYNTDTFKQLLINLITSNRILKE